MAILLLVLFALYVFSVLIDFLRQRASFLQRSETLPTKQEGGETVTMVENWAFDESAYSFFITGLLQGEPKFAIQGFGYAALAFAIQVAIMRVYAVGVWAWEVQNYSLKGDGAFTDIMYAAGDTGQMLIARTVTNIICGGCNAFASFALRLLLTGP